MERPGRQVVGGTWGTAHTVVVLADSIDTVHIHVPLLSAAVPLVQGTAGAEPQVRGTAMQTDQDNSQEGVGNIVGLGGRSS